jgi:hypothetical protein
LRVFTVYQPAGVYVPNPSGSTTLCADGLWRLIDFFRGFEIIPFHHIGQGNGAGPVIWAVVSTPILNMVWAANVGSFIESPISRDLIRFSRFSLVDDTDTAQTAWSTSSEWQDIVAGL